MKHIAIEMFCLLLLNVVSSAAFCQSESHFSRLESSQSFSGAWTTESSIGFTPRGAPAAAEVDGKIYVMGGYNATTYFNILEVFDPATNVWSTPVTSGKFSARRGLAACVAKNKIYAMGGYDGVSRLNTLEVYDPSTNTWSDPHAAGTFTAREKLCASVVLGKIYAMGGYDGTNHLNTLEVFDPVANAWSTPTTTGTFTPRRGVTSSVVNERIYVMGGFNGSSYLNTLEVFDPANNTWTTPATTGTFTARGALCSAVLNGAIYAIGGIHYVAPNYIALSTVEVFDPSSNNWSTPSSTGALSARYELAGAVVISASGEKIYVLGGVNSGVYLNTNEAYSSSSDGVSPQLPSIPSLLEIAIAPNPSRGLLNVHCTGAATDRTRSITITIENILGECVVDRTVPSSPEFVLDLTQLQRGTYLAKFAATSGVVVKKIVRE